MSPELQQAFITATGVPFGNSWAVYAQAPRTHLCISNSLRDRLTDRGLDGVSFVFLSRMFQLCGWMADGLQFSPVGCNVVQLAGEGIDADGDPEAAELSRALAELNLTLLTSEPYWAAFSAEDYPIRCGFVRIG